MSRSSNTMIQGSSGPWEPLGPGLSRQILGWNNQIMMVKVRFEQGVSASPHAHFHAQTSFCHSGRFEFAIDGETYLVGPGDGLYIAPNLTHSAVCIEAGVVLDAFSPVREDFLDGSVPSYLNGKS